MRFLGIDLGAETVKLVELVERDGAWLPSRRALAEHGKEPVAALRKLLASWESPRWDGAAVCGRLAGCLRLSRVPARRAQAVAFRHLFGPLPATVLSVGSQAASALELPAAGNELWRESSRCAQGTGNFLRQLVGRFGLTVEEASNQALGIDQPVLLSGRCPVVLKSNLTHRASQGEKRERLLAGLFDAVAESLFGLLRPGLGPPAVALVGGLARARRLRDTLGGLLHAHGMSLLPVVPEDALSFEAIGAALIAQREMRPWPDGDDGLVAPVSALIWKPWEGFHAFPRTGSAGPSPASPTRLERLPPLGDLRDRIRRLPRRAVTRAPETAVIGLDIGSTGAKAVAIAPDTGEVFWESYTATEGDPVAAAQCLWQRYVAHGTDAPAPLAVGVTGSGRTIVGALLAASCGGGTVSIENEIVAHATGALHHDARVDTIFEIGGQDAKFIRLDEGRVVEVALNEVCSAGTGSFIAEQGRYLVGHDDVDQLDREALGATYGVSLGQHCAVFMSEVLDQAVLAGTERRALVAGLYDSVARNYLERVKGTRPIGDLLFCQGMPFVADALAAAMARQTGRTVIVPPSPATVGAHGAALLARRSLATGAREPLDVRFFLSARSADRETFVCASTVGCGGDGRRCRLERVTLPVAGARRTFTWGGTCGLHDQGPHRTRLPVGTPDPFRERRALVEAIVGKGAAGGGRRIAFANALALEPLLPLFAVFLRELGFAIEVGASQDSRTLRRGSLALHAPFCAPMQLMHGITQALCETKPDFLFLPMLRSLGPVGDEPYARVCPIAQANPDLLRLALGSGAPVVLSPVVDIGKAGLDSPELRRSCETLARQLGVGHRSCRRAFARALEEQTRFEQAIHAIGQRALDHCAEHGILPIVVLGRPYVIHNPLLSSDVAEILRALGTLAIPLDCLPADPDAPVLHGIYWSFGQRILRAAHRLRRMPAVFPVLVSTYACGPDSFLLPLFSRVMAGKPHMVIESDGHLGLAGTRTRLEAFVACAREHRPPAADAAEPVSLVTLDRARSGLREVRQAPGHVLIPRMGPGAEALAACLRGLGLEAEALPVPDRAALALGRCHTSGKECLPLRLTLGSLLQRLDRAPFSPEGFAFFMPTATGPCRFGMYRWLHQLTLEQLGLADRVRIWSTVDSGQFDGVPPGFSALTMVGFAAADLLLDVLHDVRPIERSPGSARVLYDQLHAELLAKLQRAAAGDLGGRATLREAFTGQLFGVTELLRRAGPAFAALRSERRVPTVLVTGEIYVRCDPFANDFIVDALEARGLRARVAGVSEWLDYADWLGVERGQRRGMAARLSSLVQQRIRDTTYRAMAGPLGWPTRTTVAEALAAAEPYLRDALHSEAPMTLGTALCAWRAGQIQGTVNVGPLECMPTRISEAQLCHASEREGLPSLTLSFDGEALRAEPLDGFAFAIHERFLAQTTQG